MNQNAKDARTVCFEMLSEVFEGGGYAQLVLQKIMKRYPDLDERDKSFVTALFYGVITRTFTLDYVIEKKLRGNLSALDGVIRTVLRMGAWQILFSESIPNHAAVNTSVNIAGRRGNPGGKSIVNAVLRGIASEAEAIIDGLKSEKPFVRFSLSREITGLLIKWYGEEKAESIANAYFSNAKITARTNVLRCDREKLQKLLEVEGVSCTPGRFTKESLMLELRGIPIDSLRAYREGYFMIQDEAAILAGSLSGVRPGDRIMDVCAAPGGKSCHMAEISGDRADILALDIHENRLKLIGDNAERLGIGSIRTKVSNARDPDISVIGPEKGYDLVLADVPCSGLGLLLRKPDIRLTVTYERIVSLLQVQKEILQQSARFVKPGGTLMYCTCTLNPDENENRVDSFLSDHPEFKSESLDKSLPKILLTSPRHYEESRKGRVLLLPDEDGCDGFFIAKMRRTA